MLKEYDEVIKSEFAGTIIDIESVGNFDDRFADSRKYNNIIQVILGYIDKDHLHIYCAENDESINALKNLTNEIVPGLQKPLFAFNCEFEACVFFHHVGIEIVFEGELNNNKFEKKKDVIRCLNISNYDDPFFDDGYKCLREWQNKQFDLTIAHNRACLLKERDILVKRGFRKPDRIVLVK